MCQKQEHSRSSSTLLIWKTFMWMCHPGGARLKLNGLQGAAHSYFGECSCCLSCEPVVTSICTKKGETDSQQCNGTAFESFCDSLKLLLK